MLSTEAAVETFKGALADEFGWDVDIVTVAPGAEVAWDWTGECSGLQILYVQVRQVMPAQTVTLGDGTVCVTVWQAYIAVGALRCVTQGDESTALAPTPAELSEDAMLVLDDKRRLYEVVTSHGVVGTWFPLGPMGALAGGEVLAVVEVDQP